MNVVFDPHKDRSNRREHGISLRSAKFFDLDSAIVTSDDSQDYGETRLIATGFLDAKLHILVFTQVNELTIRAISLRKAVPSERASYAEY